MTRAVQWMWTRVEDLLVALGLRQAPSDLGIIGAIVEDEPEVLHNGLAYIVGGRDPVYVALACPCGCGAPLRMNLRSEVEPCWRWRTGETGAVTLSPSVWRKEGCKSHFFLRDGHIVWCDSR